jgi:hypothetical protein
MGDALLGGEPPSPRTRAVVSAFLDGEAQEEAEWLAGNGISPGLEGESRPGFERPPALVTRRTRTCTAGPSGSGMRWCAAVRP